MEYGRYVRAAPDVGAEVEIDEDGWNPELIGMESSSADGELHQPRPEMPLHSMMPRRNNRRFRTRGMENEAERSDGESLVDEEEVRQPRPEMPLRPMMPTQNGNRFHTPAGENEGDESAVLDSWTNDMGAERMAKTSKVRMDHIKPFPPGVASEKLWQTWKQYIETFEIAAAFSNANTPADRCRLLYLAMGEDLQAIVRAGGLRPNLLFPNCYRKFVRNIEAYFESTADPAVEHDNFQAMQQAEGESIVRFHTRLVEKAKLCGYSTADQPRYVHSVLLKGMRNQRVAMDARMYGHGTSVVLQAATRREAFESGQRLGSSAEPAAFALEKSRKKRGRNGGPIPVKREKSERCLKCGRAAHKTPSVCPAAQRSCNACGKRGHFAVMCRTKNANDNETNQVVVPADDVQKQEV